MTQEQANAVDAYANAKSLLDLASRGYQEAKKNLLEKLGDVEKPVETQATEPAITEESEGKQE